MRATYYTTCYNDIYIHEFEENDPGCRRRQLQHRDSGLRDIANVTGLALYALTLPYLHLVFLPHVAMALADREGSDAPEVAIVVIHTDCVFRPLTVALKGLVKIEKPPCYAGTKSPRCIAIFLCSSVKTVIFCMLPKLLYMSKMPYFNHDDHSLLYLGW